MRTIIMESDEKVIDSWIRTLPDKVLFDEDFVNFINNDIFFEDNEGSTLFLQILDIEYVPNRLSDEVRIQFRVESTSRTKGPATFTDEQGEQHMGTPVLWYTLSSGLSLTTNRENLRDFVLSHYRQAALPPKIERTRPSDSH